MAYSNGLSERMEELRFPNVRSPLDESSYAGYASPPRGQGSFFSPFQQPANDTRASLQRRFTTDSSKVSSIPQFSNQSSQILKPDTSASLEKKRQQIEEIREQKRKFAAQMKLLDLQEQGLQQGSKDIDRIANRLNRVSLNGGHVSEPTTPPEYSDGGFPSAFGRTNRYSLNNLTSPPGLSNRFSLSSSQITSPPSGNTSANGMYNNQGQKPPAKSMPGSRRNSEEDEYFPEELQTNRSAASLNRYSMPVSSMKGQQRSSMGSAAPTKVLGPLNTTSFLFDDNDDKHLSLNGPISPIAKAYMQMTGDEFPTLRSDRMSGILSANSAALDLANSKSPDTEAWASFTKPRPSHQSMPHGDLNMYRPVLNSPPSERSLDLSAKKPQRHSVGVTFSGLGDVEKYEQGSLGSTSSISRPVSLQSSYSTNDLPTMKSSNSVSSSITPPKTHAEQHFHNHNASLGRIPPGAVNNRQSRDYSSALASADAKRDEKPPSAISNQSVLQASAAPFGPQISSTADQVSAGTATNPSAANYNGTQLFPYGMHSFNVSQMGTQMNINSQLQAYQNQHQGALGQYAGYGQFVAGPGSQVRSANGRRAQNGDETRFNNVPLEQFRGGLYELCKDQHGCRYLQRKLEDHNAEHTQAIFAETCPHIVELMTDPFGNYLCQKLFELCNEDQRTALINAAAPALVRIALNQHGTRALQKMIEFVNTAEQVQTIVNALSERVVDLVQDLNGNHVIQKCLNRLGAENSQFIYDAVGQYCIIVGTHRHGCCVLQRCIDHATGFQRAQLIARITQNAFALVQDPFGNYVVQYILDLDEAQFTKPLCLSFSGNVPALSKQKFSSNVIEKCLRTADMETRRTMIDEMLKGNELEKMLRDSFANYVVQTAMDYADPDTKMRIIDCVRPILPAIKQTPHGRRIAGKIMVPDGPGRLSGTSSGQMTPNDTTSGSSPLPAARSGNLGSGRRHVQVYGQSFFGNGNSAARFNSGFSDIEGMDNGLTAGGFLGSNGLGGNLGEAAAASGFNPSTQTSNHNSSQSIYSSFGGNQPGPGYF